MSRLIETEAVGDKLGCTKVDDLMMNFHFIASRPRDQATLGFLNNHVVLKELWYQN